MPKHVSHVSFTTGSQMFGLELETSRADEMEKAGQGSFIARDLVRGRSGKQNKTE